MLEKLFIVVDDFWPLIIIFISADDYEPDYNPGKYVLYFGRLAIEKEVDTLKSKKWDDLPESLLHQGLQLKNIDQKCCR